MTAREVSAAAITIGFVPRPKATTSAVELDGEIFVYDEASRVLYRLNPSGAMVWSCCDGSNSVGDIVAHVTRVYQVDDATVRDDVMDAVRTFGRTGLLEGVRREDDADPTP